jgi:hypothetical protein
MIERNEEALSTRDLASPNEEAAVSADAGATVSPDEAATVSPDEGATAAPIDDTREGSAGDRNAGAPASDGKSEASAPRADEVGSSRADEVGSPASAASTADRAPASNAPLLPADLTATFQDRWEEVQTRFVDEPRGAVEEADGLVANLMQKLAESFAQERERLEAQWGRGEDISTEDLRVALQRYRSFFQRLLAT